MWRERIEIESFLFFVVDQTWIHQQERKGKNKSLWQNHVLSSETQSLEMKIIFFVSWLFGKVDQKSVYVHFAALCRCSLPVYLIRDLTNHSRGTFTWKYLKSCFR